jgi:hypothetical protein
MTTTTPEITITPAAAKAELKRRDAKVLRPAKNTPMAQAARHLYRPELRTIAAGAPTIAPKPVAEVKPAKVVNPHTALRQQAWAWRNAEFHAGRKVTVAAAYAKFGTHPASEDVAPVPMPVALSLVTMPKGTKVTR